MSQAALPALTLGVLLLGSGLLKLAPGGAVAATRFLEAVAVPGLATVQAGVLVRAVAGIEVALGVGLLLAEGGAAVGISGAAVLLLALMTGLVLTALRRGVDVGCGCLGEPGPPLDSRTLLRNVLLTGLASAALAAALSGQTPRGNLDAGHGVALLWALALAALGWTLVPAPRGDRSGSTSAEVSQTQVDPEDFVRTPIPPVSLWHGGSALPLHRMIEAGPRLLLLATGDDLLAADGADLLARRPGLEPVQPSLVAVGDACGAAAGSVGRLRDPAWVAVQALGVTELPAAVLLGADGWIAGGPVYRWSAILELAEEVEQVLTTGSVGSP